MGNIKVKQQNEHWWAEWHSVKQIKSVLFVLTPHLTLSLQAQTVCLLSYVHVLQLCTLLFIVSEYNLLAQCRRQQLLPPNTGERL